MNRQHPQIIFHSLLAISLLTSLSACSQPATGTLPALTPKASASPSASPAISPSPTTVISQAADEVTFKQGSIALKAVSEATEQGYQSLAAYSLPDEITIDQVEVVSASLDGRELQTADLSLGLDEDRSIVFFLKQAAFADAFTDNQSETVSVSVHSSEIFAQKTESLRTELLEKYKSSVRQDISESVPTPAFLSASVRGQSLTRQKVATLKKDAAKLTKEGVFIDRHFYCVLKIKSDQIKVQQATERYLINKLSIPGDQVSKVSQALAKPAEQVTQLPCVAEKPDQAQFFTPLASRDQVREWIEIEEIEERLELELGAELAPAGVSYDEFELGLGADDLRRIEQAQPALAKDARADAVDDRQEPLATALTRAGTQAAETAAHFQRLGLMPIPDARLFDPRRPQPPRFGDVPLYRPPGAFYIPPHLLPPGAPGMPPPGAPGKPPVPGMSPPPGTQPPVGMRPPPPGPSYAPVGSLPPPSPSGPPAGMSPPRPPAQSPPPGNAVPPACPPPPGAPPPPPGQCPPPPGA